MVLFCKYKKFDIFELSRNRKPLYRKFGISEFPIAPPSLLFPPVRLWAVGRLPLPSGRGRGHGRGWNRPRSAPQSSTYQSDRPLSSLRARRRCLLPPGWRQRSSPTAPPGCGSPSLQTRLSWGRYRVVRSRRACRLLPRLSCMRLSLPARWGCL